MPERGTEAWVWENPKAAKAEIDRLRAFEEIALGQATEIDELVAQVEALREAGEGYMFDHQQTLLGDDPVICICGLCCRWRSASEGE